MRIERLHVEGFGALRGLRLDLAPGLNVLHGANEAGKSTLLSFVRAVLFRFRGRTDPQRYEPEAGPFGGELLLATDKGPLLVRRMSGSRGGVGGEVTLRGLHGAPESPSRLPDALRGVSEELFCEVFAFSLTELSDFGALAKETSVTEALFAAGMQGARRLPEVAGLLRRATDDLWRPTSGKRPLNAVLERLASVRRDLEDLGERPKRYFELREGLAAMEAELGALDLRLRSARDERERLVRLERAAPDLLRLERIASQLAGLDPSLEAFPADGVTRLEDIEARLGRAQAQQAERAEGLAQAKATIKEIDGALLPPAGLGALTAALERFDRIASARDGLPARRAALTARRADGGRKLRGLGLSLDEEALRGIDLGSAARARLVLLRSSVDESERSLRERDARERQLARELEKATAELDARSDEIEGLSRTPPAELRRREAALRRIPLIDSEVRALAQAKAECVREGERRAAENDAPPRAPLGWGIVVAAGIVALWLGGAGWALDGIRGGALLGAIGLAMLGASAWLRRSLELTHQEAVAAFEARRRRREEELRHLAERFADAEARHQAASAELSAAIVEAGITSSDRSEVEAWAGRVAEELREADRRVQLEAEVARLSAAAAALAEDPRAGRALREEAEAALERAGAAFGAFLAERRLPSDVGGEGAVSLFDGAAKLQESLADLRAEEEALAEDARACEEASGALAVAAKACGVREAPVDAMASAARTLVEAQAALRARLGRAEAERDALERELRGFEAERKEAASALAALLKAAGARDAEGFRQRAAKAAELRALQSEAASARAAVEGAAQLSRERAAQALAEAGGAEAVREAVVRLSGEIDAASAEQKARIEARANARSELSRLEVDDVAARLREEEERLVAEAAQLAHRYLRDRLALGLLTRARRAFEQEQQPGVIRRASEYFAALTCGRYERVFVPAEEHLALRVVDAQGRDLPPEKLSRGTKEQLYLAFRLAVIEDFGETRGPLPVIVDDILVNFDPRRARAAVNAFGRLSARHQVLAFTCQPAMRDLFALEGAKVVELDAPGAEEEEGLAAAANDAVMR